MPPDALRNYPLRNRGLKSQQNIRNQKENVIEDTSGNQLKVQKEKNEVEEPTTK